MSYRWQAAARLRRRYPGGDMLTEIRRMTARRACPLWALALVPALAHSTPAVWQRLATAHFELLTDASERHAAGLLLHLEQLRRFLPPENFVDRPRIIAFRSVSEYEPYRLSEGADAYYAGASGRDYIVMPLSGAVDFRLGAHEYAHLVANHAGSHFPGWLAEGLAEVLSTIRFESGRAVVGMPDPGRLRTLQHAKWLPLETVAAFDLEARHSKEERGMFYAESWALVHMLMFSPAYSPHFRALLPDGGRGLSITAELEHDLRAWVARVRLPSWKVAFATAAHETPAVEPLAPMDLDLALAGLQLATGKRDRARAAYLLLEPKLPFNAGIQAALGRIALADGRTSEGRNRFRRAMALGIHDARLCYEYATLARDAGLPESDVVPALERALALDPALDDARYALALEHMHAGRAAAALETFQALRRIPERRAFAYYAAVADVQNELGLREEAARSAAEARRHARSAEEAEQAGELAWMAESEVVVQMSAGSSGRLRRIPRGSSGWNPFIEPGDHIERRGGDLREVDCSGGAIRLTVLAGGELLSLEMPDPARVQVRKHESGAFEFTCGGQEGVHVVVEYAAKPGGEGSAGVLRGLEITR